jgi:sulfur transfer protein SufE
MTERTADIPPKLRDLLATFEGVTDEEERAMMLIGYAERFRPVPPEIAVPPYPPEVMVPFCESGAYVWLKPRDDGRVKLYFAVENPSGISAKALAAILDETVSGATPEEVANLPDDIVQRIFRQNISMGKGMGLMAIVQRIAAMGREIAGRNGASP